MVQQSVMRRRFSLKSFKKVDCVENDFDDESFHAKKFCEPKFEDLNLNQSEQTSVKDMKRNRCNSDTSTLTKVQSLFGKFKSFSKELNPFKLFKKKNSFQFKNSISPKIIENFTIVEEHFNETKPQPQSLLQETVKPRISDFSSKTSGKAQDSK
mmetsp:Transcript_16838/g.19483  ORF Transcript_16838/g.19483 Transcript_16838/m.19483 type:complete len:154 (+) Transcript_16838:121-582(+)|eukprot:CAMPEP_0168342048 /NCGR_PEP_ID=MMETSP0213-20121227/15114_1 /TAXON_ID=151035 /ORGANISM="Euplotes harpa, Strain FSP1.4" /LENGTH=153 /DNA_ID=CAMNT_0008348775 /DNA_START=109 /DNA_END=570 /DNA_ORIENTATION=-